MLLRFSIALGTMAMLLRAAICAQADEPVNFETEIAPIFVQHCVRCHSPENKKGELSLATFNDLKANEYVVPGQPEESYLLEVVSPVDGEPPAMPKEGDPLSANEVALLHRWISAGADWPDEVRLEPPVVSDLNWWSLKPIVLPPIPQVNASHPIDAFINAKLAQQKLVPMETADPLILIRRVTFDLTGLPPTPEEIDAFVEENNANPEKAWSALVGRLLESPAFGEKWARHWLDVARYAETHGYDKDKLRLNAWPYRDYVIRSFNDDKPYTRFVEEQIAGDVLFSDEPDGVLGLGFLAAGPWDFIGHWEVGEAKLDGRIAKHLDRDEMISAVFNVFMSTTIQCAQCHHHKFDPLRMEDYYRLHAVFAAVDRADRIYDGLSPEDQRQRQSLLAEINALQDEQERLNTRSQRTVAAGVSGIDRRIAQLSSEFGTTPQPQYGYHSQIEKTPSVAKWVQVDLGEPQPIKQINLIPAFDTFNDIGAGFGFPVRYRVEGSNDPSFANGDVQLLLDATDTDQKNPLAHSVAIETEDTASRYLRVTATKLAQRRDDFIFALGELQAIHAETGENVALKADVTALDSIESGERWGRRNLTDGIYYKEVSNPEAAQELAELKSKRAAIVRKLKPPEVDERLAEIKQSLQPLSAKFKQLPAGELVYAATTHFPRGSRFVATQGKPRPIHFLHRGDMKAPGERMFPGAPILWNDAAQEFFDQPDYNEGEARAQLARYLTDRNNPLLWRSIANRIWQWTFGAPLVGTPNDFGRMGMQPTHPELLDYLAVRLRDDPDQSLKSLVRLLMTSQAYRRAGTFHEANAAADAGNAFLWRFQRRRLTAEEFRDSFLFVAGALQLDQRGGPSFQDFVIEKPAHSPHYEYHLHDPEDPAAHRRSIYRFVVRSQPQPMLTTLDCPDPSISAPYRDESTTALQALTQWNNRLVEVMSRRFAERLEQEAPADIDGRIDYACRIAFGRTPTESEREVMAELLNSQGSAMLGRVLMNASPFIYVE